MPVNDPYVALQEVIKESVLTFLLLVPVTYLLWAVLLKRIMPTTRDRRSKRIRVVLTLLGLLGIVFVDAVVGYSALRPSLVRNQAGDFENLRVRGDSLQCPFDTGGGLYFGDEPGIEPPFKQLCQKRGFFCLTIDSVRQLEGHVKIRSGAEALSYIRLLSSPIVSLRPRDIFEIVAREDVNSEIGFGQSAEAKQYAGISAGRCGIVSESWIESHHVPKPTITRIEGGWTIRRVGIHCANVETDSWETVSTCETVGTNGSYQESLQPIKIEAPTAEGWKGQYMNE